MNPTHNTQSIVTNHRPVLFMYGIKKILRKIPGYSFGKRIYHNIGKLNRRTRNHLTQTARIIIYHRIANVKQDPYQLNVTPENFKTHIKFLEENYKIIPLVQLVHDIRDNKVRNDCVVITFDDGYADNLHNALPILEEYKVPATIFLTADYICPTEPQNTLKTAFDWELEAPPEDRGRPLTLNEAKSLSGSRFIEIGAHTLTHPNLAKLGENEQFYEISKSKENLEKALNIPLLSFAYPFGGKNSFSESTIGLVKKSGFHYACANIHERVTKNSDIYALPRYVVRNWGLNEFQQELNKWI